jgi:hypothetical protein
MIEENAQNQTANQKNAPSQQYFMTQTEQYECI